MTVRLERNSLLSNPRLIIDMQRSAVKRIRFNGQNRYGIAEIE
jgi:hypothetical protein